MNHILKSEKMLHKWVALLLWLVIPALAWGQHNNKNNPPAPKAPAQHSAPAQHAPAQHPPAQHSSAPSHNAAPSHSAGPSHGNAQAGHGNAQAGHGNAQAGHGNAQAGHGNAQAGHGNTTAGQGNAGGHGNATAGHNNAGGHGNATAGHNNAAGHGNATAGHNNAAGHGNATAGHNNAAGHGNAAAGHNNAAGHGNATAGHNNAGAHNNAAGRSHTPPGKQVSLKGGGAAHIRPNGQIRSVNKNGMHIEHGMHGGRKVVSTHNGARVVSNGRGRGGYVQRAYVTRGGRSYYSRTYYYNGGYRVGVYQGYNYGGYPYYGYYPAYYYQPAYYGWAYNPWPAPVAYGWGWGGAPWYGYYGAYYQPYPVYPSAAFWLTDYLLAASLQAAYAAQSEANEGWLLHPDAGDGLLLASLLAVAPAPAETTKLSPEVKKELAEEVKVLLAAEQAEAGKGKSSSGGAAVSKDAPPPALDPKFKTFVISADLSLVAAEGEECGLTDGDVIVRTTDTPDDDRNVNVKVVASNKSDCATGKEGPVAVEDLQEMYNHFRESLKDGMGELAKKQGTGGLPKAPDTKTTAGDVPPPEPDKNAEKTLKDQAASADQTESEVKQEASSGGGQ